MKNEKKGNITIWIIVIIIIALILMFSKCSEKQICPVEPPFDMCNYNTWPPPPYGTPDHTSTWESHHNDYRSIIFMYDCLDSAYITVTYRINISQECWHKEELRKECIL